MFHGDQLDRFIRDVRNGGYSLLTGAGASVGGTNRGGHDLPLGGAYSEELCRLKGVPLSTPLQRVFALLSEDERKEHVIDRFSGCTPSNAISAIPKFIWKRIFTLNIDDCLQAAYAAPDRMQDHVTRNYRDPLEEEQSNAIVPIIHLHGWVGKADQGFVFSRDEYIRQLRHHNVWMTILAESLAVDPFVIMGTSLDEFDLEYYLSMRTPTTARPDRGPSILVSNRDDILTRHDCEKYDLILFKGWSSDFMQFLQETVQDRPTPIALIPPSSRELLPSSVGAKELATFSVDFPVVPANAEPNLDDSRFLLGREPSWSDLISNLDVGREQYNSLWQAVDQLLSMDRRAPAVLYLKDYPGSGKTTLLKRLSFDLSRAGIPVLWCSALGRVEPAFTASMLDLIDGPLIVAVDNFADQAFAISETIRLMEKSDVVFLAFERMYRDRYVRQSLMGIDVRHRTGAAVVRREVAALVQNYVDAGLVGVDSVARNEERRLQSLLGDPIAVICCRITSDLRPLDGIIRDSITQANRTELRRYLVAALAQHCMHGGVRESVLVAASGAIGLTDQLRTTHHLPLSLSFESGERFVTPLNGTIGDRTLTVISHEMPDLLLDAFVVLAQKIAPRVNRRAITRRSPEARLAGRLFDFDEVVEKLLGNLSSKFFSAVQAEWKWNSRYWEQVALMYLGRYHKSALGDIDWESLDLAVRHARHAVYTERHPLTLTTLGKVLISQLSSPDHVTRSVFDEAFEKLDEAIALEQKWLRSNVQPYITLFRGVREYLGKGFSLDHKQAEKLDAHLRYAGREFAADRDIQLAIEQTRQAAGKN